MHSKQRGSWVVVMMADQNQWPHSDQGPRTVERGATNGRGEKRKRTKKGVEGWRGRRGEKEAKEMQARVL